MGERMQQQRIDRRQGFAGRVRRVARVAAPLALALAAACAQGPLAGPPPEPGPLVPPDSVTELKIAGGLPLVGVRLPGDRRAWFLIDTGAGNFTLFDPKLSAGLGLKHELIHDPALPSIHLRSEVAFLEVDGMGRRDVPVYIPEGLSERAELADLGVTVEGVLGAGYFRGHCLWFDWAKGQFTTERARRPLDRQIALPLERGQGGELYVMVRVNGELLKALVDTGSSESLIAKEVADKARVRYDANALGLHRPTSIGPGAMRDGSVARLEFGRAELRDVPFAVIERRLPSADLLLGTDVLSRFGVILDLAESPWLVLDPQEGAAPAESHQPIDAPAPAAPPAGAPR